MHRCCLEWCASLSKGTRDQEDITAFSGLGSSHSSHVDFDWNLNGIVQQINIACGIALAENASEGVQNEVKIVSNGDRHVSKMDPKQQN